MSPSRPFILRPVATTLLMAAIMLVGMFAYRFLPLSALPEVDDPPILTLALTSKTIGPTQVQDLADTRLAQKISQLPGVGLVSVSGGQRPAVRIQANYRQLAAYGLNIDDLRTTLATANVNTPKGNFDGPTQAHTINANDQIRKPADYNDLVVAYRNG